MRFNLILFHFQVITLFRNITQTQDTINALLWLKKERFLSLQLADDPFGWLQRKPRVALSTSAPGAQAVTSQGGCSCQNIVGPAQAVLAQNGQETLVNLQREGV